MSIKIKLLVELNNEKYSVFVESDYKLITFKTVSNEIISQLNQNISLKTHSFEIYDMDFKEYVLITNENQMIENLSRIRIKSKETIELNNELNINRFDEKHEEMVASSNEFSEEKSIIKTDLSSEDNMTFIDNWFNKHFLDTKPNNSTKNPINVKKSKEHSNEFRQTIPSFVKSRSKPINYMDLPNIRFTPQEFYYTLIIYYGNKPLIGLRYQPIIFKTIKLILEIMIKNKNLRHLSFDNQWIAISNEMLSNGFKFCSQEKSRKLFFRALNLYKISLDKCPHFDIASVINPLFSAFHSFDTKSILCSKEYKELSELRLIFNEKNERLNSRNFNISNESINKRKAIDFPKLRKLSTLRGDDILMFKTLAKCVKKVTEEFGPVSVVTDFWDLVANQMKAQGFKTFSAINCLILFREYVNDYYGLVLFHSPDYKTAAEIYPLFEFIDSMDLSQCMTYYSYEKIKSLKEKFNRIELMS